LHECNYIGTFVGIVRCVQAIAKMSFCTGRVSARRATGLPDIPLIVAGPGRYLFIQLPALARTARRGGYDQVLDVL
jgi:hypothetical protein